MSNQRHRLWQKQSPDEAGMLVNSDKVEQQPPDLASQERSEILTLLPSLAGKRVLELGAGIGRYTELFVEDANQVVAIDFIKKFIRKNCELTKDSDNVAQICASAKNLNFRSKIFDNVFTNWLFMYLEDDEVEDLIQNIHKWLKPSGIFFIRESCKRPSVNGDFELKAYTHYREADFYINLLKRYFRIRRSGNVTVYQKLFNNPYQLFWLCENI